MWGVESEMIRNGKEKWVWEIKEGDISLWIKTEVELAIQSMSECFRFGVSSLNCGDKLCGS